MANLKVLDGGGDEKFLSKSGAGTNGDPFVEPATETNSGSIKTAVEAIQTAVEILDNAISGSEMQADVVTVPRSISGPGEPGTAVDSCTHAAVDLAAGTANQVIVSSAANKQIWIHALHIMADTAVGVITLQDESDVAVTGDIAVSDEGGFIWPPSGNFSMPWARLGTDKDLEADTTGSATLDGIIVYSIVDVS